MRVGTKLISFLYVLIISSCSSFSTAGGSTDTGQTFTVTAISSEGHPIENADVTLFSEEYDPVTRTRSSENRITRKTDSYGKAAFTEISHGTYNVKIVDSATGDLLFHPGIDIDDQVTRFEDTLREPVIFTYANRESNNGTIYVPGSDFLYTFSETDSSISLPLPQGILDLYLYGNGADTVIAEDLIVSDDSETTLGNSAPIITTSSSEAKTTMYAGETFRARVTATDGDSDEIEFSLKESYANVQISSDGIIEYNPTTEEIGILLATIYCTDTYGGRDSIEWSFTVQKAIGNVAPKFIVLEDELKTTAQSGSSYTMQLKATDANDTDILKYLFIDNPPGMIMESASGLISWDLSSVLPGLYPVKVYVHDPEMLSDTISWTIKVE